MTVIFMSVYNLYNVNQYDRAEAKYIDYINKYIWV